MTFYIIYTLKEELANTAINITCYDRNGEVVKRVTSDDPGTVEEPAQGDDNGTGGTNTGDNTGGNPGGDNNGGGGNPGGGEGGDVF